jgi:hypothetical protein
VRDPGVELWPSQVSFFVVAAMMNYYKNGGFYPEHGANEPPHGIDLLHLDAQTVALHLFLNPHCILR